MAAGQLAPAKFRRPHLRLGGIPVLLYHGMTTSPRVEIPSRERKDWISESQFHDHLNQMRKGGYQFALLREVWDRIGARDHGQRQPLIVLTFDDGWASDFEVAYPLLLEVGARADFFVNTGTIGKQGFLSWQQITEMQRMGMSFQSHSHDHVHLLRLPMPMLKRQLGGSKRLLEDRLGSPVDFLAAPFGLLDRRVVEIAVQEGYRAVCTSWGWPVPFGKRTIHRISLSRRTTSRGFSRLLAGDPVWYLARLAWSGLKYGPRRLLRWPPTRPSGAHAFEDQTWEEDAASTSLS